MAKNPQTYEQLSSALPILLPPLPIYIRTSVVQKEIKFNTEDYLKKNAGTTTNYNQH